MNSVTSQRNHSYELTAWQISDVLTSTIDLSSLILGLRNIIVPGAADWMTMTLVDSSGNAVRDQAFSGDQAKVALMISFAEQQHMKLSSVFRPNQAQTTKSPILIPFVDDNMLAEMAQSAEHFEILKALNFRSYIRIPLKSRNRNVGVMSFMQADSGRRFTEADLDLFQEIGSRAALTIESAQLFEEVKLQAEGFRAVTETIGHKIWVGKGDWTTEYINRRWIEYTGLDLDAAARMDPQNLNQYLIHPDDLERANQSASTVYEDRAEFEIEVRCRRYDGVYLWHSVHTVPVFNQDGEIERFYCTITDIHERKMVELGLAVEKEVAESESRAKSAFLVNISHEIRTPLNSIIGYSEILKEDAVNPGERNELLDIVIRNGKAVTQIIDDILDLSRINAGTLKIEPRKIKIVDLLKDVVSVFDAPAKHKGITLTLLNRLSPSAVLVSDPDRLRQILINLIGNAVKFTEKGSVELEVEGTANGANAGRVLFRVRDTGIGIDDANQAKLFQPFAQVDNSLTRKYGGTGIGLVLSRRLARALQGDVFLESSELGKGSSFVCILNAPLTFENQELNPERKHFQNQESLHEAQILIVEDSTDSQKLLKRVLERYGARVDLANDGRAGLAMALARRYDVILMDIQMPVMNGQEATERLRAKGYQSPIIALTAHALEEEKKKYLASGCTDFITKPIDKVALLDMLHKYI